MTAVLRVEEPSARYLAQEPAPVRAFDLLVTAPAGTDTLRDLIVDLAVRGRLVAQRTGDQSLRDVVAIETAKRQKRRFPIAVEADSPFALPHGWTAVRLGDVFEMAYGAAMPEKLRRPGRVPVYGSNGIVGLHDESLVNEPALVIGRKGSVGAVNIAREPFWPIDTSYYVIAPPFCSLDFAFLVFSHLNLCRHDKATAIPGLNRNDAYAEVIGVPPLAEQHRIVARVEELMKLCDALEQNGRLADEQHARLTSTLFDALAASESAHALAENWQRVVEHFDLLLDRPEAIDALEQTILQLAVRGLLVPQVASDEPASQFLARLCATLSLRNVGVEADVTAVPYEVPAGWEWRTVESFTTVGTGTTPSRANALYFDPPEVPWVTSGETGQPFIATTSQAVSAAALRETRLKVYPMGTLIVAMYGQGKTRGQISELLIPATTNQACAAIVPIEPAVHHRRYIKLFFEKSYDELREESAGGAQPNLNVGKIKSTLIPIPPLAEQHRIVARVDELRRLCADLRQRLTQARETQSSLADALVAEFT